VEILGVTTARAQGVSPREFEVGWKFHGALVAFEPQNVELRLAAFVDVDVV
jgi:membrane-associated protease RseP (regulator of RpoE activity)